jgi:hypothetical protein
MIVGPFLTSAGFQYWYLACFSDCIVAVPQGIWTGLMLAMSNSVPPVFGLLGALLVHFASKRGQTLRQKIEATLTMTPASLLRLKPNTVYQKAQLRSITFKGGKFGRAAGSLITPDIILETIGGKQKYGIQGPDFEKACGQLKQMYPDLCKSV